jgi:hypothetical protein
MTNSDCKAKRSEAEVSQAVKKKSLEDENHRSNGASLILNLLYFLGANGPYQAHSIARLQRYIQLSGQIRSETKETAGLKKEEMNGRCLQTL